jgi:hypothetical protein
LVKPEELAELFRDEIVRLELCDLLDLYWDWYTITHAPPPHTHTHAPPARLGLIVACVVFCRPLSQFVKRLVPDAELVSKLHLFQARYESTTKADAEERRKLRVLPQRCMGRRAKSF